MSQSIKFQSVKSQLVKSPSVKPRPFKSPSVKPQSIKSRGIKARPAILAASTGIIAIVGAWYGAGLKKEQEKKQVRTRHLLGLIGAQIAKPSYIVDTLEALRILLINRI